MNGPRTSPSHDPVRLAVFDLDGTLIDSAADLAEAINRTRAEFGHPALDPRTVVGYVGNGVHKLIERSFAGTGVDPSAALERYRVHYEAGMVRQTRPYPGVDEGLRALRQAGWRLAVLSNKPGPAARAILQHFDLLGLFDVVLGGGDTDRLKPDPAPLVEAMRRTRCAPSQTWVVGDHWTDLDVARAAGTRSVFVTYGIGDAAGRTADVVCASFAEVVSCLLGQRRKNA